MLRHIELSGHHDIPEFEKKLESKIFNYHCILKAQAPSLNNQQAKRLLYALQTSQSYQTSIRASMHIRIYRVERKYCRVFEIYLESRFNYKNK